MGTPEYDLQHSRLSPIYQGVPEDKPYGKVEVCEFCEREIKASECKCEHCGEYTIGKYVNPEDVMTEDVHETNRKELIYLNEIMESWEKAILKLL